MNQTPQFPAEVVAKAKELLLQDSLVTTYALPLINNRPAIRCKLCGLVSHNLNDVTNLYCGHCKVFHIDLTAAVHQGAV
jgi:Zn finger protein HypA/HybF involved in hydrogenase expression